MDERDLPENAAKDKEIPADALRALQEAEERRKAQLAEADSMPKELNGPRGQEPTRHGDWERKGITYDF
ncbi:DUF1674 domain-containing protein [Ponticaulis profundi]|uniref:DUF1674 domain-containing protein n=1 Tax=Ponticaulis profundi TaxID=2665222 RepID=A0ABW1S7V7_9PROT